MTLENYTAYDGDIPVTLVYEREGNIVKLVDHQGVPLGRLTNRPVSAGPVIVDSTHPRGTS